MLGGFLRRGVSTSDKGDHIPPLASPFKQTTPSGSGSRPFPFPPRRPLRRERRAAMLPSDPTLIASTSSSSSSSTRLAPSHSTSPYPSSSLLMCPETPANMIPPSSSPPPAPKRSRIRRRTRHVVNDSIHDLSIVIIPPLEYPSPDLSEDIQAQPVNTKISSLLDSAFRRSADRIQAELIHLRNLCAKVMTNKLAQCEPASSVPVHTNVGNYPASPTSYFEDSIMAEAETETEVDSLVESSDNVSTYSSARSSPSTMYYSLPSSPRSEVEDLPTGPSNHYSPTLPLDPLLPRSLPMRDTPTLSPITFCEDSTLLPPLDSSQPEPPYTRASKRKRSDNSSDDYSLIPHPKRQRARSPSPTSSVADEDEVDRTLRAVTPGPEPTRTLTDPGTKRDFDAGALLAPRSYVPFDQIGPSRVCDSVFLLD